ncbi:MAG: sel1 repeat family protein [Colwelliaceae bacterium]|nr:sel1 repeat family protein [Colwelliaceae bacterium]
MDYRESTLSLGTTDKLLCACCGGMNHNVNSIITYGYYFLEYLPIFPVKRGTKVHCLQCANVTEVAQNSPDIKLIFSNFSLALFNKLRLLSTFTGSIFFVLLLSLYFSEEQQKHRQSQVHIDVPKVNDFYYLDYRKVTGDFSPHHKYRIAKIVDITGGTVSLTYGNYFYPLKSSLSKGLHLGHTRNPDYFEKNRQHFSYAELDALFQQGFIYRVVRPEINFIGRNMQAFMIEGNIVIDVDKVEQNFRYVPGKRQNTQGMGFLKATYIEDRFEQAFDLFKQSSELGYAPGQTNLAELYLSGIEGSRDVENAVHWLFKAALQGYQPAIEKYRVICQLEEACQIEDFYQALNEAGTAYSIY